MKLFKIFTHQYFWLGIIILLGLTARLYKLDAPIADWHSWRQADTAAVTRNFIKTGFNPLVPRYDDMSGVAEKPLVNPEGYRFVEFPVYNIAVYPLYLLFGVDTRFDRLVSILFSLASTALIFLIVKKYAGKGAGLLSAFIFALLPFNVFFSRTTLPEPTFVFFALGMIYFTNRWIEEGKMQWILLGLIFTATAFLMKPWASFFYLPLLYSVWKKGSWNFFLKFVLFSAVSILPFALWRLWMLQAKEGIPASNWLLNGDGIRFRPAFWWWLISERISKEILGVTGLALFVVGFLRRPRNDNYFLHFWALSSFLFMIVVATGNVRHNYYQTLFVPVGSIFLALGLVQLLKGGTSFIPRIWTIFLAFFLLAVSFGFTYRVVKEFYKINNPDMVEAGKAADKILPKDAIVVAPYSGDTAFLYQTNRRGFPVGILPLKELVSDFGATSYVSTSRDDKTNWVLRHFVILEDNPKFVIADLTRLKLPPDPKDPEP